MTQCPGCGLANSPGRIYCGGCARALGAACPVCFFVNEPGNRYCGGCAGDLLAPPAEPAPAVRVTVAGPAAPTAAAALDAPRVSPVAPGGPAGLMRDLLDLDDLASGKPAVVRGELCPAVAADATQKDVDGFFQRLAREGVAEIHPPTPPEPLPGTPRRTPS